MPRSTSLVILSEEQESELARWLAGQQTPQQVALRCRIIEAASRGEAEAVTGRVLGINRQTVRLWKQRFATDGLPGLWEIAPGRGRKPMLTAEKVKAVIDATLQTKPKGSTHWSCRTMAAAQGISKSAVAAIWSSHHLQPHRTETFKLSRDPKFLEKLTGVVGLYPDLWDGIGS
jgi:transposase